LHRSGLKSAGRPFLSFSCHLLFLGFVQSRSFLAPTPLFFFAEILWLTSFFLFLLCFFFFLLWFEGCSRRISSVSCPVRFLSLGRHCLIAGSCPPPLHLVYAFSTRWRTTLIFSASSFFLMVCSTTRRPRSLPNPPSGELDDPLSV